MNDKFCERCCQSVPVVYKFLEGSYAQMLYPNGVCYSCQVIMHPELNWKLEIKNTDENLGPIEICGANDTEYEG